MRLYDWLQNKTRLNYTRRVYINQKGDIYFYRCFEQSKAQISTIHDGSQMDQICLNVYKADYGTNIQKIGENIIIDILNGS